VVVIGVLVSCWLGQVQTYLLAITRTRDIRLESMVPDSDRLLILTHTLILNSFLVRANTCNVWAMRIPRFRPRGYVEISVGDRNERMAEVPGRQPLNAMNPGKPGFVGNLSRP
jgi:hypothetical protein